MSPPPREPTTAEAELERIFNALGGGALAGEYLREWPLGNWFIDFYFPAVKLAIEVDGGYHRAPLQWRRDLHKAAELDAEGITLLRITNAEVFGERQHLIEKLRAAWRSAQARTAETARAIEHERATGATQHPQDRFKLHEPAAPAYAVASAVFTAASFATSLKNFDMIFAKELALLQTRAIHTARRAVSTALLATLAGSALPAFAQTDATSYPNKPIRIIVNFPPGGTADVLARAVSEALSVKLGQPVVVENRAGAGGNIGAQAVFTAPADGYTLLATPPGPLTINQSLYRDLGYDPLKFVPVILLASVPNAITARPDLPANSVKELIAYAKANPGKVTYASQGNGSTSHLSGQMFASMTGVEMVHVPFKGEGPALVELFAGRVDLFFGNISAVLKFRDSNRVKLLGLAAPKRGSMAPDLPTVAEGGVADFNASAWFAIVAPPGTPAAIAQRLNSSIAELLKLPDVQRKFAAQGAEISGGATAELTAFLESERTRWKKVIDTAKVTLD